MRVLFVSECPFIPTSLGKITYWLSKGLINAGFDVFNACFLASTTLHTDYLPYNGLVVYPYGGSLMPLVNGLRPDLILLFGTPFEPNMLNCLTECYNNGLRCVGYFDNESLYLTPNMVLGVANTLGYASPSEFARRTIADVLRLTGIPEEVINERSAVVPHGIMHNEIIENAGSGDNPFRMELGNSFIYGTFSKNHPRKGIPELMTAYASLPKEVISKTKLFLPLTEHGESNTHSLGQIKAVLQLMYDVDLNGKVVTLNPEISKKGIPEPDLAKVYDVMDVFMFPSRGEAFGLPPVEASALSKPLILTEHPTLKEVWEGYPKEGFVKAYPEVLSDGYVLVKADVNDLRNKLLLMYKDERLRKELGSKAKEIGSKYTVERMVESMIKFLEAMDGLNKQLTQYNVGKGGKG